MPAKQVSDKIEGRERHKRTVRVKRKSSSRRIGSEDGSLQDQGSGIRELTPTDRKSSMPIPELNRRLESPNASHTSLPYPTFSKAHSREAVGSAEDVVLRSRKNVFTPDPTDLQEKDNDNFEKASQRQGSSTTGPNVHVPPSPPLTATEAPTHNRTSPIKTKRSVAEGLDAQPASDLKFDKNNLRDKPQARESRSHNSNARTAPLTGLSKSKLSKQNHEQDAPTSVPPIAASTTVSSVANSESTDATPMQARSAKLSGVQIIADDDEGASSETGSDISVRTPTPRGTPAPEGFKRYMDNAYPNIQPSGHYASPIPPPPPPPPAATIQVPRVDYLMQYGGLRQSIPKRFINAPDPDTDSPWVAGQPADSTDLNRRVQAFFTPFRSLLDGYTKVIDKSGSIAVATGYRSIARRLLDRLEAVFARDISSEVCACLMCDTPDNLTLDDERGVSWGEILEYVSGREELPKWPPFVLAQGSFTSGSLRGDLKSPCQTLDVDVPEEYREHYIRQSKKTKESVDRWLSYQSLSTATPPEEADDDTLTFAILTHLDPESRSIFKDLLGVPSLRPGSTKPMSGSGNQTPLNPGKTEIVEKSTLAIQRLYRLGSTPRAPEVATFLVNNQYLHNVLATLAAISDAEWDILTSGRFDGFLRSGAEDSLPQQSGNGSLSRGPTPFSTRSPSAASAGAPVAIDEETEIAVLAEVEREIFTGMEALEDAFENLHTAAETVRRILRDRGAGLAMAAQARRGSAANVLEARLGTPAMNRCSENDLDEWLDDTFSELAPDDSASMIIKNRTRRKRRDERRTPAPIEEVDDSIKHENERLVFARVGGTSRNSFRRRC